MSYKEMSYIEYNKQQNDKYKKKKAMNRPLLPKMRAFCDNYILTGDIKKSAILAGYSEKSSMLYKLLKTTRVVKYIESKRLVLDKKLESNFNWKIKKLSNVVESVVGETKDEVDKRYIAGAISAISEMNKMQGHHSAEKVINIDLKNDDDIKKINDIVRELQNEQ